MTSTYPSDKSLSSTGVRKSADKLLCVGTIPLVTADPAWLAGLQARILEVLEKRHLSRRGWSLKAGLSQSHVGMILRGDVGEGVSSKVLDSIARAADISPRWLTSGQGSIDDRYVVARETVLDERYPSRSRAADAARIAQIPEEIIQEVLDDRLDANDDPGFDYWFDDMRSRARRKKLARAIPKRLDEARTRPKLPARGGTKR